MRRDYFTLAVTDTDWVDTDDEPLQPGLIVSYEGPAATLRSALHAIDDEPLGADDVDVAFRLQAPMDDPDATGVIGVFDRLTGDVILEMNGPAEAIFEFIRAARRYGESDPDSENRYSLEIRIDEDSIVSFGKRTFLVYNRDGSLLRQQSLIPSGVEL